MIRSNRTQLYWGWLRQGYITLGYRGTFAIGRGDMSTTGFRKLTRLLVCGKSALCREVFKVRAGTAALQSGSVIDAGHTQRKQRSWQRSGWRQVGSWVPKHYHRNWVMSFIDDITSPHLPTLHNLVSYHHLVWSTDNAVYSTRFGGYAGFIPNLDWQ